MNDFNWISSAATHPGKQRRVNEDSLLNQPDSGLWAVADGMGGHHAGDVASRRIVEALATVAAQPTLDGMLLAVEEALRNVNQGLLELAITERKRTIGSTVVALIAAQNHVICLWVGDSRIYRSRKGRLEQLTQDHAMVEEMVQVGLLSRDEAESHPQANRITRAVGATAALFTDLEIYRLEAGDRFLLCSDGLYKELSEPEIARTLANGNDRENLADVLIQQALQHEARDNITAVIVDIH